MRLDDSFPASDPPSSARTLRTIPPSTRHGAARTPDGSAGGNCALRGGRQDALSTEDPLSTELVRLPVSRVMLMR